MLFYLLTKSRQRMQDNRLNYQCTFQNTMDVSLFKSIVITKHYYFEQ